MIFIVFCFYNLYKIEYKENVMKNMTSTNEWIFDAGKNYEYLFLIEK